MFHNKHRQEQLRTLVFRENQQAQEEGKDLSLLGSSSLSFENLESYSTEELQDYYNALLELPISASFEFEEPTSWNAIQNACGGFHNYRLSHVLDEGMLFDKIYGGILGRSCGCTLGDPFPSGVIGPNNETGYELLKNYLKGADAWPLTNYLPGSSAYPHLKLRSPESWLENVAYVQPNDDLQYTILSLIGLESIGYGIETKDIARLWMERLTFQAVSTAERQAYLNLANIYGQSKTYEVSESDISFVSSYQNPWREWIGAQIRADGWAYACPGEPGKAAKLAWLDGRLSHHKNGVYGAMFMAALIAAAFVTETAEQAVDIALKFIPKKSRLWQAIKIAKELALNSSDQESLILALQKSFGNYHPIHTVNNAAVVTASLIFGKDDFTKSITTAVLTGWDSDCNGASVGSVWGVLYGAENIPDTWKQPLNDTLFTGIAGFHPTSIVQCAWRIKAVIEKEKGRSE